MSRNSSNWTKERLPAALIALRGQGYPIGRIELGVSLLQDR
jgi:hypothetical protein